MHADTITRSFWWDRARGAYADVAALEAVIFDVDGTIADTERDGHRLAFNAAFAQHGLDVFWDADRYGRLLRITGGRRRIAADLLARGYGEAADRLATAVHETKTALFRDSILNGDIDARPGLLDLIWGLHCADIRIAIATTGRRSWVEPLVRQLIGDGVVEVMITGEDVTRLKPDPEAYQRALHELGLRPQSAMAVEDSEVGLKAASGAGLATVIVTTDYTAHQDFTGAAAVLPGYDGPEPLSARHCQRLHGRWWLGQRQ
ncbi:HAD-IA family hydrolase [Mycobacterium sp. shizuoka-1]|uniref:HAD-IA family hydrolase n=1 Tax=Mycobacterium sp. shizuoka-1 TaxID=2039281 RepID=UPI000C07E95C|nr:HAD-IA family hydrolase [Mycobacterium sp. shizuoka-1]